MTAKIIFKFNLEGKSTYISVAFPDIDYISNELDTTLQEPGLYSGI